MFEQIEEPDASSPPFGEPALADTLGTALTKALADRGFTSLTEVQRRVLSPELDGKDLRVSSQTGSGKTVAIGFVLRYVVTNANPAEKKHKAKGPRAVIIVPTRELAKQVHLELSWLYQKLGVEVTSVTGGASYRDEKRAIARGPGVVVGTPGRLLDHLKQGAIDVRDVQAVVLDEADQMLDLGFREELEAILEQMPEMRQTHLVSATFARELVALANRVQKEATHIEGTRLGDANTDIEHIVHLVDPRDRLAALINLLLFHPDDQTLVFAKTRADVAQITAELVGAGFSAGALSGEMEQAARQRALAAFKTGRLRVLVATDVAARGIDVQNIARVVQLDAPSNADTYTHRSGRTGRAGRKGKSQLLISKGALRRTEQLLRRAGVKHRVEALPSASKIRRAQDERWFNELSEPLAEPASKRVAAQVARLVEGGHTDVALIRLLSQLQQTQGEPRELTDVTLPSGSDHRERQGRERQGRERQGRERQGRERQWVTFRVSVGQKHGTDARRLLAMLCRRGKVRGADVGAIRVEEGFSIVDVERGVAADFAEAVRRPDPRDPRVTISLFSQKREAPRPTKKKPPARPKKRVKFAPSP